VPLLKVKKLVPAKTPIMRLWIFFLFLAVSAAAQTPEDTVRRVYETHFTTGSLAETVRLCESCFTPGFLGVMERALAKKPGSDSFVDFDFFVNSQAGFAHFEVGKAVKTGKEAVVGIRIWNDERGYRMESDPKRREQLSVPAQIHMIDVGNGLQIKDIEFLPREEVSPDGETFQIEGHHIRATLLKIAEGR
jgi:hypothetical protein